MLFYLSLGLLAAAIGAAPLPLKAQEGGSQTNSVYFQCRGEKTQGSGSATGFPMNHPILVKYQLDQTALTLTEVDIDPRELSAGQDPIPVKIYGNTLITEFRNRGLQKDYEIQIRGGERLFSITVFPSNRFEPDAWYGQCVNMPAP
jgi:hypothetical protein